MGDGIFHTRSTKYPYPGEVYRHYKGGLYIVFSVLHDADDRDNSGKSKVGYMSLEDGTCYSRNLKSGEDNWMQPTDAGKTRFSFVGYGKITIDGGKKYVEREY